MRSLFFLLNVFIASSTAWAAVDIAYDWHLQSATDESGAQIDLDGNDYTFKITQGDTDEHFAMKFGIGNSMGCRIKIDDVQGSTATVSIDGVRSTKMRVADDKKFKLESFLSNNLPQMETFAWKDDSLHVEGSGEIIFTK